MEIKDFILAGDSAGGHLSMAVTYLAMLRGFRIPDGIFCHYPAFMLDNLRFFPSLLLCLDEELLNQGFLSFAMACFMRKGGNPAANLIMSPLYAPDSMIAKLPPCRFMAAEVDALRDNSFVMALRMLK